MKLLPPQVLKPWKDSSAVVRVAPFLVFLVLTSCQGQFGEESRYWFYLVKTVVGAWLVWEMRSLVTEMRWTWSWSALAVGIGVFAGWVGLDGWYPTFAEIGRDYLYPTLRQVGLEGWRPESSAPTPAWNPHAQFGADSGLAWLLIVARLLGSTFVVPPLEEVFYRSFLYRYLAGAQFLSLPLGLWAPKPFLFTSVIFGLTHHQWLAGILCGLAYQGLVVWRQRLGDAMTAHAITNLLLGLWVVGRGAWHFW